jgi:hypothetical protein
MMRVYFDRLDEIHNTPAAFLRREHIVFAGHTWPGHVKIAFHGLFSLS